VAPCGPLEELAEIRGFKKMQILNLVCIVILHQLSSSRCQYAKFDMRALPTCV